MLNECHIHNMKIVLNIFKKEKTFKEKQLSHQYNSFLHVYFLKIIVKYSCEDDSLMPRKKH